MEKVIGRVADFLVKKEGIKVAGISLIENTLTKIDGIRQMQIIQEELEKFSVRLVPEANYCKDGERELVRYLKEVFGMNSKVEIELVEKITKENSGKFRFSICKLFSSN